MTVKEELEILAKDCEETAAEALAIQGREQVTCAEQRAWLSVAYRIRHAAKRIA